MRRALSATDEKNAAERAAAAKRQVEDAAGKKSETATRKDAGEKR
jgi:hypothetical protein